jgi:hypothetical protein
VTHEALAVPASADALTPEWLSAALGRGAAWEGMTVERIGEAHGLASTIVRCRNAGAGTPRSVIVKLWSTDGPAGSREVPFHSRFGHRVGIRVPACHHGAIDARSGRAVLVLEDLAGARQGDCLHQLAGEGAVALADTLAALQATWWDRPELHAADWLPDAAERDAEWLRSRRAQFLERFSARLDPIVRALLDDVEGAWARATERLAGAPPTLLHGDLHLDNVVFLGEERDPVLLDWARVARGPGVLDLAELVFEIAPLAERDRLLGVYGDGLRARGVAGLDAATLRHRLGGALLRKAIAATCGVARWMPASAREARMIELGLERVTYALEAWRPQDPGLFG